MGGKKVFVCVRERELGVGGFKRCLFRRVNTDPACSLPRLAAEKLNFHSFKKKIQTNKHSHKPMLGYP